MADITPSANPLFLREEELRRGIELLFYAYRDFTAEPDAILARYKFGRAHHRVIYFVGRNPGITVGELLAILRITKQSLSRVLGHLVRDEFIRPRHGARDRRRRLLYLTDDWVAGAELMGFSRSRIERSLRRNAREADIVATVTVELTDL